MKPTEVFFQEKPARIMLILGGTKGPVHIAKLAEGAKCTYAHAFRVVQKLESLGLVKSNEQGRLRLVKLTELGNAVYSEICQLSLLLELVEVSCSIDQLYDSEIRGKLREEINKELVLQKADEFRKKLEGIASRAPEELKRLVKKEVRRIEELTLEVKGIVVGAT